MTSIVRNSQSKLTETDVRAIRILHDKKLYTARELAGRWNVSRETVFKLLARTTWCHVK